MGELWKAMAMEFCNPPEAPIWMADHTFKSIGDVKVGDEIVGWADAIGHRNKLGKTHPKLCRAKVVATGRRFSPIVKVTMKSGATIRCTPDHLWWLFRKGKIHTYERAEVGKFMTRVIEIPTSLPVGLEREAGWIAGITDGEVAFPCLPQCRKANPEVWNEIGRVLDTLGFPYTIGHSNGGGDHYFLTGGRDTYLRFANWINPVKRGYLDKHILTARFGKADCIVSIEPDGEGEVVSLTTSTGNYVVWGYASKNCTTRERYQLLGDDGITMEDFDFNPGNMIPSHMDGEDPTKPSRFSPTERARMHLDSFRFNVVPNSLTQISAVTKKLMYIQLYRDKTFPMSPWDLAEQLEVPNFGPPPPDTKDMMDRWKAWMQIQAELQQAMTPQEDNPGALGATGRPPTAQVPAHIKQRADGSSTIAES
jgi:hypothetical protein